MYAAVAWCGAKLAALSLLSKSCIVLVAERHMNVVVVVIEVPRNDSCTRHKSNSNNKARVSPLAYDNEAIQGDLARFKVFFRARSRLKRERLWL